MYKILDLKIDFQVLFFYKLFLDENKYEKQSKVGMYGLEICQRLGKKEGNEKSLIFLKNKKGGFI